MFLSKDQILAADDRKYETVPAPEWGGEVRIRSLTGLERDRFEQSLVIGKGKKREVVLDNSRARLASMSIVDEHGKLQFTERDVEALGAKSAAPLDRIFDAARKLSGLDADDVDDAAKN